MGYFGEMFRPFRRDSQPSFVNRKTTIKVVTKWLADNGWTLLPLNDLGAYANLLARKGPSTLAIVCTGMDMRLLAVDVGDLRRMVIPKGHHSVFIYGEERDPRVWAYIRPGADIILPLAEIDAIPSELQKLSPTLISMIDSIQSPNIICGWTKISPSGQATITAYTNGEIIGACQTNAEKTRADGTFRFRLEIKSDIPPQKIEDFVHVKAAIGEDKIWGVPFWGKLRILPAP